MCARCNAQLIDAESDTHLGAERFNGDTERCVCPARRDNHSDRSRARVELIGAEAARSTDHPDVLDYILRGRAARTKPPGRDRHAVASGWFERALEIEFPGGR
jgi:hypothetical protein